MANKITRTKRTGSKGDISDLAKAAASRGKDAGNVIANQVIDRIVNNSSEEFQRYLAQAGNGSAAANAASLIPEAPAPVPFGNTEQALAAVPPVPFGSPAALYDGAMASDVPYGMPLQPAPFATPPVLMPNSAPPMPLPTASPLPSAPSLLPNRQPGVGPEMEMLLRSIGLI